MEFLRFLGYGLIVVVVLVVALRALRRPRCDRCAGPIRGGGAERMVYGETQLLCRGCVQEVDANAGVADLDDIVL